tara:strand:+ start:351 stop:629 length:279 start_codon:yes stop_codon:yes gene_type:complete
MTKRSNPSNDWCCILGQKYLAKKYKNLIATIITIIDIIIIYPGLLVLVIAICSSQILFETSQGKGKGKQKRGEEEKKEKRKKGERGKRYMKT